MGESTQDEVLPLRVDLRNKEVWQGIAVVKLTRRTFDVLCCLLNHKGHLVTKETIFRNVWHADGVVVSDAALTTCIKEIRKALHEHAKNPRYIETVSGRGYRFIGPLVNPEDFSLRKAKSVKSSDEEKLRNTEQALPQPAVVEPAPVVEPLPIVGREREFTKLHSLLAQMLAGERKFIFVTGEAGIGKTTLVRTFLRQVAEIGDIGIGFGQCIEQFGSGEPYRPVLEAMNRACRDPRGAFLVEWMKRYTPTWLLQIPTLLTTEELRELERKVSGASKERMLREMGDAVGLLTEEMPLILVLEDLQWSDTSTLNLLALLARRQERARFMVIGTYRPEEVLIPEHPLGALIQELLGHKLGQEIALSPLDEATVGAYVDTQFPISAFPTRFPHVLSQVTGGNPLFLTAVIDDLKERNIIVQGREGRWELQGHVDTVLAEVPSNIRLLLERQIARLRTEEQLVIQAASIAGLEFSAAAVAAAVEMPCASIEICCEVLSRRRHFLQPAGYSDWPDGVRAARYRFRHAIYQYLWAERVPMSLRHQFHLRIGLRLESAYGTRCGEVAAELALHFEQGGDYMRALRYLQEAAGNAMRRYSHQEAIMHLTKGLQFVNNLPSLPVRQQQELSLRVALGSALIATKGYSATEVESSYSRALELCREVEESPQLLQALWGLESFYAVRGKFLMARELSERCLQLAENQRNPRRLLSAHWTLGQVLAHIGDFPVARHHLQQAMVLYHPWEHRTGVLQDPGVTTLAYLGKVLWLMGYPEQALVRINEALALADQLSHPFSKAFALTFAADLYSYYGDISTASLHAQEAVDLCRKQGFPAWLAFATVYYGRTLCLQKRWTEGIVQIRRGLTALQRAGAEALQPMALAFLAEAYAGQGLLIEAGLYLDEALVAVERSSERYGEAELYRLKGKLMLAQSSVDCPLLEAEQYFLKAIDIARQQQAKFWELRTTLSLARLWLSQGRAANAQPMLAQVYSWFHEGRNARDLMKAKKMLALLAETS